MESVDMLQQSRSYLRQYADAATLAVKNREDISYPYLTLLAWTKHPPESLRGQRVQDQLMLDVQDRVAAILRPLLRKTWWFASWMEQNPGVYRVHVGALAAAALQRVARDENLKKPDTCARLSRPESCNAGLVSLIATIITRSRVIGSHNEFERGTEIILRSLADDGWADYDKESIDLLNPAKKARCSDVHVAKRWRSESTTPDQREAITRFFSPERESDVWRSADDDACGDAIYSFHEPHCGLTDDPVLEALMAAEEGDAAVPVSVTSVPQTPPALVETIVNAVRDGIATPRKVAGAIAAYPARSVLRDRFIALAVQGSLAAADVLLAIEDLAAEGLRFGQRQADFLRAVTDCLAAVTPEPRMRYAPAEWPGCPEDAPHVFGDADAEDMHEAPLESVPAPGGVPAHTAMDPLHPVGIVIPVAFSVIPAHDENDQRHASHESVRIQVRDGRRDYQNHLRIRTSCSLMKSMNVMEAEQASPICRPYKAMDGRFVGDGPPGRSPPWMRGPGKAGREAGWHYASAPPGASPPSMLLREAGYG